MGLLAEFEVLLVDEFAKGESVEGEVLGTFRLPGPLLHVEDGEELPWESLSERLDA